jgi:hypothetical protein
MINRTEESFAKKRKKRNEECPYKDRRAWDMAIISITCFKIQLEEAEGIESSASDFLK